MASFVDINVVPKSSLMDELVHIKIDNLIPGQHITIKSYLKDNSSEFTANGLYIADHKGKVDCMTMKSYGGSYIGCDPMGLICYLTPEGGLTAGKIIRKKDVTSPHLIDFTVSDYNGTLLGKCNIEKYYKADTVFRIPIRQGKIRGILFSPNYGDGEYPAIIDLYGMTGGLPEYRAALLSSRGFLVLALAYSQYEDLPNSLTVDLEYFEEAIDFITSHKNSFKDNKVGIIGLSYGATLAMDIARISQKVKAVVVNGASSYRIFPIRYKAVTLPYSVHPKTIYSETKAVNKIAKEVAVWRLHSCTNSDSIIDIHEAKHSHFLILHGVDDQNVPIENALKNAENLRKNGHMNYSLHIFEGTGHLIEPPYMPFTYASWNNYFKMITIHGGQAKLHSRAQENAWQEIILFFNNNLNRF